MFEWEVKDKYIEIRKYIIRKREKLKKMQMKMTENAEGDQDKDGYSNDLMIA